MADQGPLADDGALADEGALADRPGPVVGVVVNPIAGLGGRVGLKGTDGEAIVSEALARGAHPLALERAREALAALAAAWPAGRGLPALCVAPGPMGAEAVPPPWGGHDAGRLEVLAVSLHQPTTADDTRACVTALLTRRVDLLLLAGGDGTARDVHAALCGASLPVLGIPAGVKIQSAVFATSPRAAGTLIAEWLAGGRRRTVDRDVLDIDEDAYRAGRIAPRFHGTLAVPEGRALQGRKSPTPADERVAAEGIAHAVVASMEHGRRYVLGPGSTVAPIAQRLGLPKTLAGVDVIELEDEADGAARTARVVVADAGERELLDALAGHPATIVVTPIGGQGFLFGRGNQPISPAVIRAVGREHIMVVATATKLAALGGRPLLVDTGDPALDRKLTGPTRVVTGTGEAAIVRLEPA